MVISFDEQKKTSGNRRDASYSNQQIVDLYRQGKSLSDIARLVGVSRQAISQLFQRLGIKTR